MCICRHSKGLNFGGKTKHFKFDSFWVVWTTHEIINMLSCACDKGHSASSQQPEPGPETKKPTQEQTTMHYNVLINILLCSWCLGCLTSLGFSWELKLKGCAVFPRAKIIRTQKNIMKNLFRISSFSCLYFYVFCVWFCVDNKFSFFSWRSTKSRSHVSQLAAAVEIWSRYSLNSTVSRAISFLIPPTTKTY